MYICIIIREIIALTFRSKYIVRIRVCVRMCVVYVCMCVECSQIYYEGNIIVENNKGEL